MTHELKAPVYGEIKGTAVVRDKDGNIKGTFEFGGPATEELFNEMKEAGP